MSRPIAARSLFLLMLLVVPLFALGACNTMEGAGEDIQAGGRAVERSAERSR